MRSRSVLGLCLCIGLALASCVRENKTGSRSWKILNREGLAGGGAGLPLTCAESCQSNQTTCSLGCGLVCDRSFAACKQQCSTAE